MVILDTPPPLLNTLRHKNVIRLGILQDIAQDPDQGTFLPQN